MTLQGEIRDFYTRAAVMTSPGAHAPMFDGVSGDMAMLSRTVQGLLLHEHWASAYGIALSDERRGTAHVRPTARMLDHLLTDDGGSLIAARPIGSRLVGVCRHFTVLSVAMLRARGIPARARCGFGTYFERGRFIDHWVCEYWNADEGRWILADTQLDELQRSALDVDFDTLDVPRDRFVIAGDAWALCRAGKADPSNFGILDMQGLWFVAGNVLRDLAALNNMEMLPWDVWGAMPAPNEPLDEAKLRLFDELAAITHDPDASFAALRALYESDDRLRVPASVVNARLNRMEAV